MDWHPVGKVSCSSGAETHLQGISGKRMHFFSKSLDILGSKENLGNKAIWPSTRNK